TVSAISPLTHMEYHGEEHEERWCRSRKNDFCWYDSVGFAESHDGGDTWTHPPPPAHLVAAVPRRYVPDQAGFGMGGPTNIVRVLGSASTTTRSSTRSASRRPARASSARALSPTPLPGGPGTGRPSRTDS